MSKRNIERLFNVVSRALFRIDSNMSYSRTLVALERLAEEVHSTDTDESIWYLGESEVPLTDILVGAYWFLVDYHGGQGSDEYRVSCVIGKVYSPGIESGPTEGTGESDTYSALEDLWQEQTGASCTFTTGNDYTFKTGNDYTFKTGNDYTFKTGK